MALLPEASTLGSVEGAQDACTASIALHGGGSIDSTEAAAEASQTVEAPLLLPSPDSDSGAAVDGFTAASVQRHDGSETTEERGQHGAASPPAALPLAAHADSSLTATASPTARGGAVASPLGDQALQAAGLSGDGELRESSASEAAMPSCSDNGRSASSRGSVAEEGLAPIAEVLQRCLVRRLLAQYHCTSRACLR